MKQVRAQKVGIRSMEKLPIGMLSVLLLGLVGTSAQDMITDNPEAWIEPLSWSPRAFLYHNFLSVEERDHLISVARAELKRSSVADNASGKSYESKIRTSSGMFLKRGQDAVIAAIEKRIAAFSMVPADHGEGLQVLRYEIGQKYDPHFDYFHDKANQENGGQRVATVLMYLRDVEEGGETVFPNGTPIDPKKYAEKKSRLSECGRKGGLAVKPNAGDALLFWSLTPTGIEDPTSLHQSCPVISGEKWTVTKWMRRGQFKFGNIH